MADAKNQKGTAAGFDEDEDLFQFDELYADKPEEPGEELDLEEFLRAFADEDSGGAKAQAAAAPASPAASADAEQLNKAEAPASAAAVTQLVAVGAGLPRGAWIALFCLVAGQLVASALIWIGGQRTQGDIVRRSHALESSAEDLTAELERRMAELKELARPIVSPDPIGSVEAFARVDRQLELGDFARARRELYALLAIVDRLPEEQRGDAEARARFLLADSLLREAEELELNP
ncbi:MAG: hypothetical protein GC161_18180 [Planctomycetaceae bacterium]|nr:hypothetical protein [Planctomycetaceae bacterium]